MLRLELMCRGNTALAQSLARARGLCAEMDTHTGMAPGSAGMGAGGAGAGRGLAVTLARKAAKFLQQGTQVAVLEVGGWDSHANQALPHGATSINLRTLDAGLAALREGLPPGETGQGTAVLVATEFGREVAVNGTLGTDHCSGGAAFVPGRRRRRRPCVGRLAGTGEDTAIRRARPAHHHRPACRDAHVAARTPAGGAHGARHHGASRQRRAAVAGPAARLIAPWPDGLRRVGA